MFIQDFAQGGEGANDTCQNLKGSSTKNTLLHVPNTCNYLLHHNINNDNLKKTKEPWNALVSLNV